MSLLVLAEARAVVASSLGDGDFQAVIDREEAWLARRVGPLSGARTVTYWPPWPDRNDPLALPRPTAAVSVVDGGVTLSAGQVRLLRDGTAVERADAAWQGPSVALTFTPSDALEVKGVLIEIIRLTLASSAYSSESIGDYSYTLAGGLGDKRPSRQALARSLLARHGPGTIRLRSAVETERVGLVT